MNLVSVLGIYGSLLRELGQPFCFPGSLRCFESLFQVADAGLLARAAIWISITDSCANQAFNITNGDFIRWESLWPRFAGFFGLPVGPVKTVKLAQTMADKAPVWERIVEKYGLKPVPYAQIALWPYADFVFTPGYDIMSDTLKLRQTGFNNCLDTEKMFLDLFKKLRAAKVVP